jgi:hypothetical protein
MATEAFDVGSLRVCKDEICIDSSSLNKIFIFILCQLKGIQQKIDFHLFIFIFIFQL